VPVAVFFYPFFGLVCTSIRIHCIGAMLFGGMYPHHSVPIWI